MQNSYFQITNISEVPLPTYQDDTKGKNDGLNGQNNDKQENNGTHENHSKIKNDETKLINNDINIKVDCSKGKNDENTIVKNQDSLSINKLQLPIRKPNAPRFTVVKIPSLTPYCKGRWFCNDSSFPTVQIVTSSHNNNIKLTSDKTKLKSEIDTKAATLVITSNQEFIRKEHSPVMALCHNTYVHTPLKSPIMSSQPFVSNVDSSSLVKIVNDNVLNDKIDLAMDLFKSHLKQAIQQELEILKAQIHELWESNKALQFEISFWRASTATSNHKTILSNTGIENLNFNQICTDISNQKTALSNYGKIENLNITQPFTSIVSSNPITSLLNTCKIDNMNVNQISVNAVTSNHSTTFSSNTKIDSKNIIQTCASTVINNPKSTFANNGKLDHIKITHACATIVSSNHKPLLNSVKENLNLNQSCASIITSYPKTTLTNNGKIDSKNIDQTCANIINPKTTLSNTGKIENMKITQTCASTVSSNKEALSNSGKIDNLIYQSCACTLNTIHKDTFLNGKIDAANYQTCASTAALSDKITLSLNTVKDNLKIDHTYVTTIISNHKPTNACNMEFMTITKTCISTMTSNHKTTFSNTDKLNIYQPLKINLKQGEKSMEVEKTKDTQTINETTTLKSEDINISICSTPFMLDHNVIIHSLPASIAASLNEESTLPLLTTYSHISISTFPPCATSMSPTVITTTSFDIAQSSVQSEKINTQFTLPIFPSLPYYFSPMPPHLAGCCLNVPIYQNLSNVCYSPLINPITSPYFQNILPSQPEKYNLLVQNFNYTLPQSHNSLPLTPFIDFLNLNNLNPSIAASCIAITSVPSNTIATASSITIAPFNNIIPNNDLGIYTTTSILPPATLPLT